MTSHFYKVSAKNISMPHWKRTWIFHSTKVVSIFSLEIIDIMTEWDIEDIREIVFNDMEIVEHWDNQ